MINKLKNKITLIIYIPLILMISGIIIFSFYSNYENTITTTTKLMDRIYAENGIGGERPRTNREEIESTSGLYYFTIKNSEIKDSRQKSSDEIKQYAITLADSGKSSGIYKDYIYTVKNRGNLGTTVMLSESSTDIYNLKLIGILSVTIFVFSAVVFFIIARKLANVISKPVEDTLSKQVQFISDASHELKTPLAVIEANAEILENEYSNNKWISYIEQEVDSMNKLINNLLLLSKIENVDRIKDKEEFDLSEQVELVSAVFESMAYEKKIKLNFDLQKDIKFLGYKEDIEHIVSTLLDNAIKHTEPEKEVIVDLKKEKDNIILQVKNMGEPIPKEERKNIFERFYRVDKARNREEKRYGLGLAIAKSTVEKYDGEIRVDYQDGYTIFKVIIHKK